MQRHLLTLWTVFMAAAPGVLAQSYTHDGGGQLTSVSYPSGELVRYTYDLRGNLTQSAIYAFGGGEMEVLPESDWRYLDDGTQLRTQAGVSWLSADYDDSTWRSGNGRLGYGDAQTTTVGFGPDANNKYITTYFRKSFVLADLGSVSNAVIHVLRNDGAVVYLNGTELFRGNMPAGPIDDLTLASSEASVSFGGDGIRYFDVPVDRAQLVPGRNQIAVEVHQAASDGPNLGFDLAWESSRSTQPPQIYILSPSFGAEFLYSSNIVIRAIASDPDGNVPRVELFANGTKIGDEPVTSFSAFFNVSDLVPGIYTLVAVATDNAGSPASSAPVQITVSDPFGLFSPILKITRQGTDVVLSWTAEAFYLQMAESPEGPWTTLTPLVASPFRIASPADNQFFRLTDTP